MSCYSADETETEHCSAFATILQIHSSLSRTNSSVGCCRVLKVLGIQAYGVHGTFIWERQITNRNHHLAQQINKNVPIGKNTVEPVYKGHPKISKQGKGGRGAVQVMS